MDDSSNSQYILRRKESSDSISSSQMYLLKQRKRDAVLSIQLKYTLHFLEPSMHPGC